MPKGELRDYAATVGQAWCIQTLQEFLSFVYPDPYASNPDLAGRAGWETNEMGCWLWVGPTLNDGHKQFKRNLPETIAAGQVGKNTGVNFLLHRVSFVAKNGRDVVNTGSHLCDIPRCFNPDHICDEDMVHNNSRKGCQGVIHCPTHDLLLVDLCRHQPKCLRPQPPNVACCHEHFLARQLALPVPFASPPALPSSSRPSSSGGPPNSSPPELPRLPPPLVPPPAPSQHTSSPDSEPVVVRRRRHAGLALASQALLQNPSSLPGSDNLQYYDTDSFIVDDDDEMD